jgi:DNA helicase-2/ATP-dependent DNA helicase PcrA
LSKLNIQAELNGPQLEAVAAIEGPVLIIAGAGSGKTRVITYRMAHMLEKGIPQHAILALTFTNKAAKEMDSRVKSLTGKKLQSLRVSTFHAFGLDILRNNAEALGYRKNFSIYDETDRMSLIKESLRECRMASAKVDLYALGQLFSNIKTGLAVWDSRGKEKNKPGAPAGITETLGKSDMLPVYEEYQQGLKVYNAVDFDDLLVLPLELFEQRPEILEQYRQRYRYIMVDEFQDTSLIQYRLLRLLVGAGSGGEDASPGRINAAKGPNVCVVGDDDQSIYSWRGANYENLLLFEKDFPGLREIKLEQNYRSTSTILEAANGVIAHNRGRKEKTLWSGTEGGKPIELFFPENENAEARFIAAEISRLSLMEKRKYHHFGVLTRTNSLARNIEEAFLAENIPYKVSGGTSFFQRKEIKDLISYLRVIANPEDDISLLRIINTPRRGIGKAAVAALSAIARKNHTCLWDALERFIRQGENGAQELFHSPAEAGKTRTELGSFKDLIETWRGEILERKAGHDQSWLLSAKTRQLVEAIDYWGYLVAEHGGEEKKARWKYGNIEYFLRMIENWERDPDTLDKGLYPWLNRISLITRDDGEDDTEGKVNLMTIHASKGLEFPVVFIAGAEQGLIPHERSLDGEAEAGGREEERRLFYVAITRARDKLYITSCRRRRRMQTALDCAPSPFLKEIPSHLITYHQEESAACDDAALSEDLLSQIRARLR